MEFVTSSIDCYSMATETFGDFFSLLSRKQVVSSNDYDLAFGPLS